jgi:hypothetical protein
MGRHRPDRDDYHGSGHCDDYGHRHDDNAADHGYSRVHDLRPCEGV